MIDVSVLFVIDFTRILRILIFVAVSDRIYQTRPFTGRVTVTHTATDSERTRGKSAVATVPGQLSANLLECLCVSLAALSLHAQRAYIVKEEKEERARINLITSLARDGKTH